ncbi:hypothetical protein J6590_028540 [Homalodisca vitripennis]|nr:hypothetical protein J6590_028540 [Homalodisca vitripennis]
MVAVRKSLYKLTIKDVSIRTTTAFLNYIITGRNLPYPHPIVKEGRLSVQIENWVIITRGSRHSCTCVLLLRKCAVQIQTNHVNHYFTGGGGGGYHCHVPLFSVATISVTCFSTNC